MFWGQFSFVPLYISNMVVVPLFIKTTQKWCSIEKTSVCVDLVMFYFHFSDLQLTGIILRAAKRFQINVYVKKLDDFM